MKRKSATKREVVRKSSVTLRRTFRRRRTRQKRKPAIVVLHGSAIINPYVSATTSKVIKPKKYVFSESDISSVVKEHDYIHLRSLKSVAAGGNR